MWKRKVNYEGAQPVTKKELKILKAQNKFYKHKEAGLPIVSVPRRRARYLPRVQFSSPWP